MMRVLGDATRPLPPLVIVVRFIVVYFGFVIANGENKDVNRETEILKSELLCFYWYF